MFVLFHFIEQKKTILALLNLLKKWIVSINDVNGVLNEPLSSMRNNIL